MNASANPFLSDAVKSTAAGQYERDGYFIAPPLISADLLARVRTRIAAVYAGEYETGIPPVGLPQAAQEPPKTLVKIDNSHRSDRTILELVSHPAIGRWAAALTGGKMIQVFATQLLIKPAGGQGGVNVGWHQDQEYWEGALQGEIFTAWVAISDVTAESGPMRFVRGSNHWGLLKAGDFFSDQLDALKQRIQAKRGGGAWQEVAAVLPPGGVSFHHRLTVHGSGPNLGPGPRVSFAIHLRTEKSGLRDGVKWQDAGYLNDFNDRQGSPLCYRETPL
jgi:ectoine hydroxylase-related dioxygenase (phytanoyl-CoA dioxygenase family)